VRLEYRIKRQGITSSNQPPWVIAALQCQAQARTALEEFNLDSGWQSLHTAQSMEIWGYDSNEVANARAVLCKEAAKLGGWRQDTVTRLVCDNSEAAQKDTEARRKELYQATLIRHEQFSNLYHKIRVRGRSLRIVFLTLALIVVGFPLLARVDLLPGAARQWRMIVAVELIGMFGAVLSVASSLTRSTVDVSIPQQTLGAVLTWMRPLMGAAAAVAAYLFFQAGTLPLTIKADSRPLAGFVIAFLAGFSERFIIGAVGEILREKK
jgi:hypothetical protein